MKVICQGYKRALREFSALACFACALAGPTSAWAVCYVDSAATGANDGSSWKDAYINPQFALLNKTCGEVWVAKGVYKPTFGSDRTVSFVIASDIAMYGGFSGVETDRDQRSPATNLTVLSGDIDSNDAHVEENQVDITPTDIIGSNSFHVVYISQNSTPITASTTLDGFTITGGDADGPQDEVGGGLYCFGSGLGASCSPTLRNLVFSGNFAKRAGGALFNDGSNNGNSSPTLIDVTFNANNAKVGGGAMFNDGTEGISSPSLTNVFFNGNVSTLGGAMYNAAAKINHGVPAKSSPFLTSVMFSHNAASDGGAIYNDASEGAWVKPLLYVVTFTDNTAMEGNVGGGAVLNSSVGTGSECVPTSIDVTFTRNLSDRNGGAVASVSSAGGKIESRLTNVTVSLNSAEFGGGIYNSASASTTTATLANVVLWADKSTNDSDKEISLDASTISIDHSVIQKGCPADSAFTCSNILTSDPLLGPLSENGGFTRTMMPQAGSSAIDTGLDSACPANDQRGLTRPQGLHCEIGAVEVLAVVPPIALPRAIVMPFNTSRSVTFGAIDSNPGGLVAYSFAVAKLPAHGMLGAVVGDTILYTPAHNYVGPDTFTYTVTDINGVSAPATVTITVLPPGASGPGTPTAIPTLSALGLFGLAGMIGLLSGWRVYNSGSRT